MNDDRMSNDRMSKQPVLLFYFADRFGKYYE